MIARMLFLMIAPVVVALRSPTTTPRRSVVVLRGGAGGGVVSTQWSNYLRALEERPMRTKMMTSAVLSGTGSGARHGAGAHPVCTPRTGTGFPELADGVRSPDVIRCVSSGLRLVS